MIERSHYSPDEFAARIGVHRATIWRRMADGTLPYLRFGKRRLIPANALPTNFPTIPRDTMGNEKKLDATPKNQKRPYHKARATRRDDMRQRNGGRGVRRACIVNQ